jgi:hypothetical protein
VSRRAKQREMARPPTRKSIVVQAEKRREKKAAQLFKRTLDYEHDVPRCQTCVHYSPNHCDRHQFGTTNVALCRDWRDRAGYTLAP